MRAWLLVLLLACISSAWLPQVASEACDDICYTTDLTGFGRGGKTGCTCVGTGPTRIGPNDCSCGQCYDKVPGGAVLGYGINSDGTCTFGVNCGNCEKSSDASGSSVSSSASASSSSTSAASSSATSGSSTSRSSTSSSSSSGTSSRASGASSAGSSGMSLSSTSGSDLTPFPSPASVSPSTSTDAPSASTSASDSASSLNSSSTAALSDSSSSAASSTTAPSSSSSGTGGTTAGSSSSNASSSSDSGLATWQIALIICCGVLIFTVAVVSVLTCYCKARNRLNENEDAQADATYYHQSYPGSTDDFVFATGSTAGMATPSRFAQPPGSAREMKAMYASSVPSNSDRIGLGLVPARTSSGDLAGNYSSERRPSAGSNSLSRRASQEMQYMSRDRDSMAVEL